jgi:hypothetical protein
LPGAEAACIEHYPISMQQDGYPHMPMGHTIQRKGIHEYHKKMNQNQLL